MLLLALNANLEHFYLLLLPHVNYVRKVVMYAPVFHSACSAKTTTLFRVEFVNHVMYNVISVLQRLQTVKIAGLVFINP